MRPGWASRWNSAPDLPVRTGRFGRTRHDVLTSRLFLALLLLALPVVTVVLPADPLWIAGLYDGADYDDCLAICDSTSAGITPPIHTDLAPPPPTSERVVLVALSGPPTRRTLSTAPRSPPSA